jgi:hypothetical protein
VRRLELWRTALRGHAWGVSPTRATQARDPAFRKVAKALLLYPVETMEELANAVAEADTSAQAEFELELPARRAMQMGRVDANNLNGPRGCEVVDNQPRTNLVPAGGENGHNILDGWRMSIIFVAG